MRRTELDLCRIAGCVSVMIVHTTSEFFWKLPIDSGAFFVINLLATAVRGCVPLFFMLSGILFLGREEMDLKKSILPRAFRLIALYFLWSAVYAVARLALGQVASVDEFLTLVIQGHYHLWFLPAMAICYLFLPVIHSAVHGKKLNLSYLLILFLLFSVASVTVKLFLSPDGKLYLLTQVFSLEYLPYVGYAILGAWLDSRPMPRQMRWAAPLVFLAVTLLAAMENLRFSLFRGVADGLLFDYFSVTSFLQATAVICFLLSWKGELSTRRRLLPALSDATLGVYLIHPMLIGVAEKTGLIPESLDPVLSCLLLSLFLTAASFLLTLIARRIPLVRKAL